MTELRWRNVWGKINFSSDTHTLYLCRFTMRPHRVHPCACGEYDTSILRSCLLQISFRRNDTCTREFCNDVRGSKMKQDRAHWPGLWVSEHAEVWVPSFPHPAAIFHKRNTQYNPFTYKHAASQFGFLTSWTFVTKLELQTTQLKCNIMCATGLLQQQMWTFE